LVKNFSIKILLLSEYDMEESKKNIKKIIVFFIIKKEVYLFCQHD